MDGITRAAELLRGSSYSVALTGAGISVPSGIPDFRSPSSGLWDNANPLVVASLIGFRLNPQAFFNWVRPLTRLTLDAQPNPAHLALAHMEQVGRLQAVITQNIDLLHTRAGSRVVHEVHGSLSRATCVRCFKEYDADQFMESFITEGKTPKCPKCGGVLKPNVILFGEALPHEAVQKARDAVKRCEVMIIAGSSLVVAPVCDWPADAKRHGAHLIIINKESTPLDDRATIIFRDDVAEVLPKIADALGVNKSVG
jgi:NAD-dependent deacetylase